MFPNSAYSHDTSFKNIVKGYEMTMQNEESDQKQAVAGTPGADTSQVKKVKKGVFRGNKEQISLTFPPEMIELIDERAKKLRVSRAAFISMVLANELNKDM
jgi:hypothetical protein